MTGLPFLARALLRLTDPAVREFVTGDLEEACASRAAAEGADRARRWIRRQAFAAVVQHPWKPARSRHTGDGFMRTLLQDLNYGARMIRRQPTFSAVIVMTLALAIGANTVIFSFANILLVRPLPIKDTDTLAWIFTVDPHRGGDRGTLSIPELLDYRKSLTSFDALGASTRGSVTLTGRGDARRLAASRVTANLIDLWGVRLQAGRGFSPGADVPGAPGEVVISHHYWDRELNRDPSIVGQTLMLDGRPATVTGVLAPEIEIGNLSEIDVWTPLSLATDAPREERTLRVNGRLKPGVTLSQANADVRRIAQLLSAEHPATNEGWTARVAPAREAMTGTDTLPVLALLSVVVSFVLLLACANVANLVLARATGRRRELAVRSALGASRARVVRQMLTENIVYGAAGGLAGLGVASLGLAAIRSAAYEPFFAQVRIDGYVLGFTAALALVTPLLFGLLPALQSTRADGNDALKDEGTRSAGGRRGARSRSMLIVTQLALAVMLLVLGTLLVRSLRNLVDSPLGFDASRVLTARLDLPAWKYPDAAARSAYYNQLFGRLQSNPRIERAGTTNRLPLLDGEPMTELAIDGRTGSRAQDRPWAVTAIVSDAYFDAAGIPLVAGRFFSTGDQTGRPAVAVVNAELARRQWGSADRALGARIRLPGGAPADPPVEVIGVVGDVLRADHKGVNPQMYLSARQRPTASAVLIVRAADPSAAAPDVRAAIRAVDPDVPVYELRPMQEALDDDLSSSRVLGSLFVAFAIVALILAVSGLYAVVSYSAAQRTKEIGVRVALGAQPADITRLMLRQACTLVAIGIAIGLVGGRLLATVAPTLLFGVSASDPVTYVAVAAMLGAVALIASYVPVRRVLAIDPVRALRLD